ncbi:hypothetical protein [Paenibacillus tundrae]|nr:hypothetical protein [Paenibacillus tundrae]
MAELLIEYTKASFCFHAKKQKHLRIPSMMTAEQYALEGAL